MTLGPNLEFDGAALTVVQAPPVEDGASVAVRGPRLRTLAEKGKSLVGLAASTSNRIAIPLLVVAVGYTIALFVLSVGQSGFGMDYLSGPWIAGQHLIHGVTPYIRPHGRMFWSGIFFDYPVFAAFALAPLSLLSAHVAAAVMAGLSILAVVVALRLVGLRDLRVYALVLLWPPVIMGWQFANPSLILVLGVAICWRYRDRAAVTGVTLALMISLKVFLWPLLIWLLATRRRASLGYALAATAAINLVSWGVVGYAQIGRYLSLLRAEVAWVEIRGSGLVALFEIHGASSAAAHAAIVVLALGAGLTAAWLGRTGNDLASFTIAIAVSLIATPLLWPHYYALLAVPLAIAVPRLATVWALPFLMLPAVVIPTSTALLPTLRTIPALHTAGWPIAVCVGVGVVITLVPVSRSAAHHGLRRFRLSLSSA